MNVKVTESFEQFMWRFHREELPLVLMGHTELAADHWDEYIGWCKTDEGKHFLKEEA